MARILPLLFAMTLGLLALTAYSAQGRAMWSSVPDHALGALSGNWYWDSCVKVSSCEMNWQSNHPGQPPPGGSFVCPIGSTSSCARCDPNLSCDYCVCQGDEWALCVNDSWCDCGYVYTGTCDGSGGCAASTPTGSHCGMITGTCCP